MKCDPDRNLLYQLITDLQQTNVVIICNFDNSPTSDFSLGIGELAVLMH